MSRYLWAVALGLIAGLWEVAVRPFLPSILGLRPLLPLVVLFMVSGKRRHVLACAIAGAFLIDLFSISTPDLALLRYIGIVFALGFVSHHFLTNRSLYASLGLVVLGRLLEFVSAWLFGTVIFWLGGGESWVRSPSLFISWGWDVVLVGAGFLLLTAFTRRSSVTIRASDSWYGSL